MLPRQTQVGEVMIRNARMMALNANGTQQVVVMRKKVTRKDTIAGSQMGGNPTLGGMGVASKLDEDELELEALGEGRLLITGQQPGGDVNSAGSMQLPPPELTAIVVSLKEPNEGGFEVRKGDIAVIVIAGLAVIAYEVMQPVSAVGISPYPVQFMLSPRDDLDYLLGDLEEDLPPD